MKAYNDLFGSIATFENIHDAAHEAIRGKKKESPNILHFFYELESEVIRLESELVEGDYTPGPYSTFWVRDPKLRRICCLPFRDRVVHHAVCRVLGPCFEACSISDSFACRPGKGTHRAITRAQQFSRNFTFFLKLDIRKFFDSIDQETLKALLGRKFTEHPLRRVLHSIIEARVPGLPPGKGQAIGNLTSQYYANFYLTPMDHFIKQRLQVGGYLRYMDDFILFSDSKGLLHGWHAEIQDYVREILHLDLKSRATVLAPVSEGIPFLGKRIFPNFIRLDKRSKNRFIRLWEKREQAFENGDISKDDFLRSANSLIGHAKGANTKGLRRSFFYGIRP
jgi:retron-type reverse transcriptase